MRDFFGLIGLSAFVSVAGIAPTALAQETVRRSAGHAHNDYEHERPLLDALDAGFNSVEADVFVVDGQLLVAHTAREITPERSLQKLYLDPLQARVAAGDGHVHPSLPDPSRPFYLLIDIKSDGLETYRQLHAVLEDYADILTSVEGDQVIPRAIQVVVTGNRPQEFIASQTKRYCGIDGRVSDLASTQPAHLLPLISDNWAQQFSWRGSGPIPANERQRMEEIVQRAHEKGRTVRFWGTPENSGLWKVLQEAQVDWINTDQLKELSEFLEASARIPQLTKIPFQVNGHPAFLITASQAGTRKPWVWYAPTLGTNLPGEGHRWYFERFLTAGIGIAGIDLGEVRGSPRSNSEFLAFHEEMVRRGYSPKPVLLGQSRGGLMMLSFAAQHPDKLSSFVGIYPVCNLSSWPLMNSKTATLSDYGMSEAELRANLPQYNPVDHLDGLIKNNIPIFAVHGDADTVVPLAENSGLLESRYTALGGKTTLKVIAGEGHKVSDSFFECSELVTFVLQHCGN